MSEDSCGEFLVNQEAVAAARRDLLPAGETQHLAQTFKVLGDPLRLQIINALFCRELCVCDLATLLETSSSAVSHQLRRMKDMGLVRYRREGKIVYYALDDDHISQLFHQGLEHIRHKRV